MAIIALSDTILPRNTPRLLIAKKATMDWDIMAPLWDVYRAINRTDVGMMRG